MKIVVNCWALRNKQLDGIGYFTVNTIKRIIETHPEVSFIILCDKKFHENYFDFKNVELVRMFPALRHPFLYVLYLEIILPFYLKKIKPDLIVAPDGMISLRTKFPQLPVLHDLNFETFPENLNFKNRVYFKFFFKKFAKKAKRIATVSLFSKNDIQRQYNIPENKIDVVWSDANNKFRVLNDSEKKQMRQEYAEGKNYFFFIGTLHPRKNLLRLLLAFNEFKQKTKSDFKLIIGGGFQWDNAEFLSIFNSSPFKNDIKIIGRVADNDLVKLLGSAYALIFVSIFEGFGVPLIEAFESGIPVLTSNITSLPEIAEDAAVYVNPMNVSSISEGLEKLFINENNLCSSLVENGFNRRKFFSWDKSSELLWESILKASQQLED